jgi:AcrR family transcriptional regulator
MPKVTEDYRKAKRAEIADAAMVAFRRRGFQATSIADIIAESGLSAGAIYGHYSGKADLVSEVAERVANSRIAEFAVLAALDPMPSPANLLRVLVGGMLKDMGSTAMLVQLWGEAVTDPDVARLISGVVGRLRDTFIGYISLWQQRMHGLSRAEADALATEQCGLYVGAAQGFILQSALINDFDREAYLDSVEKYLPA